MFVAVLVCELLLAAPYMPEPILGSVGHASASCGKSQKRRRQLRVVAGTLRVRSLPFANNPRHLTGVYTVQRHRNAAASSWMVLYRLPSTGKCPIHAYAVSTLRFLSMLSSTKASYNNHPVLKLSIALRGAVAVLEVHARIQWDTGTTALSDGGEWSTSAATRESARLVHHSLVLSHILASCSAAQDYPCHCQSGCQLLPLVWKQL
jgi:hypothetical protein